MIPLVNQLRDYFDPPQKGTVEFQYYIRSGGCHNCGACCSGIYLVHGEEVIESVEQFEKLKNRHEDYRHFIPMEETDMGVMFKCRNLQPDNSCGIYDDRPLFCRKYPSEATLVYGGSLAPQCGYLFKAKHKFADILNKTSQKKTLRPGKLLNDILPEPIVTRDIEKEAG
jgi:Fe-S-cluster containining protein